MVRSSYGDGGSRTIGECVRSVAILRHLYVRLDNRKKFSCVVSAVVFHKMKAALKMQMRMVKAALNKVRVFVSSLGVLLDALLPCHFALLFQKISTPLSDIFNDNLDLLKF